DPSTRLRAPVTFVAMAVSSVILGLGLVYARDRALFGHPSFLDRLDHVLLGLVGVTGPLHFRTNRAADLNYDVLFALGAATLIVSVFLALRAPEPAARLRTDDESRVREFLTRHGARGSLAHFALRRDKAAIFSEAGQAAVSDRGGS